MKTVRKIKRGFTIGIVLLVLISMTIWGQYSDGYKKWFLKHKLGTFPSSITIQEVYGSKWEIDYSYIFELYHTKEATNEIVKRGFFLGGDPGPDFVRQLIEEQIKTPLDQSLQWVLYKRETKDVKMYYIVPSSLAESSPETFVTSYLYVYTT